MKETGLALIILVFMTSCHEQKKTPALTTGSQVEQVTDGSILVASDIITEVIIKPDPNGDPWETEKVSGYKGSEMVNTIFERIYNGTLVVYDYHSGEPMSVREVKDIEKEFKNDRTLIGKLSFTEDWYFNASTLALKKVTKSVVLGYQTSGDDGRIGYRAAFRADLAR